MKMLRKKNYTYRYDLFMNGALKWSNAYNNKTYNNKKGQQKQRCLYYCMKLLFLLSNIIERSVLTQSFMSFFLP